ncbi:DUF4350 domain-containing protein [Nitriliruptoraceae bacterium ZYF776]|nr:DUF4350 domain-containing protein [Profundirhabdus halotolerans]
MTRGRLGLVVAGVVVALLAVATLRPGPPSVEPYALDNTGPQGLAVLAQVLDEVGVDVSHSSAAPVDADTRALVTRDLLRGDTRDDLLAWVEAGGILVVTDPTSPLHGLGPSPSPFGSGVDGVDCELDALREVRTLDDGRWWGIDDLDGDASADLDGPDAPSPAPGTVVARCLPLGDGTDGLVVVERGAGSVVAMGSADPFTNARIAGADHVVLATALLGAGPGDRLHVVEPPPPGGGDATVLDLVPDRVVLAFWLVVAAAGLVALRAGRRLGPPVPERLPPVLPSAELARSVGSLLQRGRARPGAAARLRADARLVAARSLGLPPTIPPPELVAAATRRLDLPEATSRLALLDDPVADDDALLAVANATATLRAAAAAGRTATSVATTDHLPEEPPT